MLKKEDKLLGTGRPIVATFWQDDYELYDYTIELDGRELFTGRLDIDYDRAMDVDISTVIRDFVEWDPKTLFDSERIDTKETVSRLYNFKVVSEGYADQIYNVMYNYNTDYRNELQHYGLLNIPISNVQSRRSPFFITYYNFTEDDITITINDKDNKVIWSTIAKPSKDIICERIAQPFRKFEAGKYYIDLQNKNGFLSRSFFEFVDDFCDIMSSKRRNVTIYYQNTLGGIDSLMMVGKEERSRRGETVSFNKKNTYQLKQNHTRTVINTNIEKIWNLNTGILFDSESTDIDELIFSPRIWLFDETLKSFVSVYLNKQNVKIKNFANDKRVSYTMEFIEDKKYIRR